MDLSSSTFASVALLWQMLRTLHTLINICLVLQIYLLLLLQAWACFSIGFCFIYGSLIFLRLRLKSYFVLVCFLKFGSKSV